MDALRHPDLVSTAQEMRCVFDQVLRAEHAAAEVAHRRSRELRELLLELEDRGARVSLQVGERRLDPMTVGAVGLDHVLLGARHTPTIVPMWAIDLVEVQA